MLLDKGEGHKLVAEGLIKHAYILDSEEFEDLKPYLSKIPIYAKQMLVGAYSGVFDFCKGKRLLIVSGKRREAQSDLLKDTFGLSEVRQVDVSNEVNGNRSNDLLRLGDYDILYIDVKFLSHQAIAARKEFQGQVAILTRKSVSVNNFVTLLGNELKKI
jgi:hypothetical protein